MGSPPDPASAGTADAGDMDWHAGVVMGLVAGWSASLMLITTASGSGEGAGSSPHDEWPSLSAQTDSVVTTSAASSHTSEPTHENSSEAATDDADEPGGGAAAGAARRSGNAAPSWSWGLTREGVLAFATAGRLGAVAPPALAPDEACSCASPAASMAPDALIHASET